MQRIETLINRAFSSSPFSKRRSLKKTSGSSTPETKLEGEEKIQFPDTSEVIYLRIGGQGCLINEKAESALGARYIAIREKWIKDEEAKKGYARKLLPREMAKVIEANQGLSAHIQGLLDGSPCKSLKVGFNSSIYSEEYDEFVANQNRNMSYFDVFYGFFADLKKTYPNAVVDDYLLEGPIDSSRFSGFYAAVQRASLADFDKTISVHFYNSNDPFTGSVWTVLYEFLQKRADLKRTDLVPSNVTAYFHRYGNSIVKLANEPVEIFNGKVDDIGVVYGTGKVNPLFEQTICELAERLTAISKDLNVLSLIATPEGQKIWEEFMSVHSADSPKLSIEISADSPSLARSSSAFALEALLRLTPPSSPGPQSAAALSEPSPPRHAKKPSSARPSPGVSLPTIMESPMFGSTATPDPQIVAPTPIRPI